MRIRVASVVPAQVMAGIMKWANVSEPLGGSQCSCTEKRIIIIRPSQNVGMEMKIRAKMVLQLSIREYCFTAQAMPRGMPMRDARIMLYSASWKVVGKREKSSSNTGRPET